AFLIRRLLRFVVVCIGVSLVTFLILHASGDPVALIMPEAPEADRVKLRDALGLSDPVPTQFVRFVSNAVRGDFGRSFFHRAPAFGLVVERMPTTLALTSMAVALALGVALPVGVYGAVRRNTIADHAATVVQPAAFGHDPEVKPFPYDPKKAKELPPSSFASSRTPCAATSANRSSTASRRSVSSSSVCRRPWR
ncbi:MAG: hypothetical protein DME07_06280, partial [Candidatus Rokuibacteriota bacterium]